MANTVKMLDLNVGLVVPDSAYDGSNAKIETQMVFQKCDYSDTSSSSVVNVDDDDSGDNLTTPSVNFHSFNFGALRKGGGQCDRYTEEPPVPVTMQLFPVGDSGGNDTGPPREAPVVRTQWLNLSVPNSGVAAEMRSFEQEKPALKKSRRGPRSQSSQYRGVTFYRRTGRWESHIWDCGKQVYLGGFDTAHSAARAYDRAAIKFRGLGADINFEISDYKEDMEQMKDLSKLEFVHALRRQNTGAARGNSKYRAAPYKCGQWEAQMGQILGIKPYDQVALNGLEAATNDSRAYPGELHRDANGSGGNDFQNLDLNLWISPSINSSKVGRGPWRRGDAPPPPLGGLTNLAWKMQGHMNSVNQVALYPLAASSGFPSSSSSVIAGFPVAQQTNKHNNKTSYIFQLPTSAASSTVAPQYYSHNNNSSEAKFQE